MKIVGLKLTHDGAVAGIEDGKLVFCVEAEKIENSARYSRIDNFNIVEDVCHKFNFYPDRWVVDGWKQGKMHGWAMDVAGYHEFDKTAHGMHQSENLLSPLSVALSVAERSGWLDFYQSFTHITGHIVSAYCTAPWAKDREPCYSVTWDGGQNPRIHYVNPEDDTILFVGHVFDLYGIIYGIMGRYWGPYAIKGYADAPVSDIPLSDRYGGYEVPGKIMSYIATGKIDYEMLGAMMGIYFNLSTNGTYDRDAHNQNGILEHALCRGVKKFVEERGTPVSDATILHTLHSWLEVMLVENTRAMVPAGSNLTFSGGSALNIKWNSALRRTGHFKEVWVPPFPNDSGSAIGAACAEMIATTGRWHLDWSVYCGAEVEVGAVLEGWSYAPCSIKQLAGLFHAHPDEAVVFLNGRCEVGPRALGNRSIFMSATLPENKATLNAHKKREEFRPVAPICLEHHAHNFFSPGSADPYMLFDHKVIPGLRHLVPAIVHLDGTARLQTVNAEQNADVAELLEEYCELSGIPMLCNTSANFNGSGFFPDVRSSMAWGQTKYIWSNGILYTKDQP